MVLFWLVRAMDGLRLSDQNRIKVGAADIRRLNPANQITSLQAGIFEVVFSLASHLLTTAQKLAPPKLNSRLTPG
jgi:hypothetical protein